MNDLKALFDSLGQALSNGQKLKDLAPVLASYKGDEWNEKPEFLSQSILPCGGISYKEGDRLLHEIFNHSRHRAASLHIYSPPHYRPRYFQK
jgi:hypothetical protein